MKCIVITLVHVSDEVTVILFELAHEWLVDVSIYYCHSDSLHGQSAKTFMDFAWFND